MEHVVSAAGIARIYHYLRSAAAATGAAASVDPGGAAAAATDAVDAEVRAAEDPSAVVAAHGTRGEPGAEPHCVAAMEAFLDALGAEARVTLGLALALGLGLAEPESESEPEPDPEPNPNPNPNPN